MKKTQLFTLLVALLFISCSQNDENSTSNVNPPSNSIKKITETTYIAGSVDNLSADFNYENGILKSISDATHKIELSYNGATISSSIIYNNNVVSNAYSFNYNGTFLETILNTKNNFERTLYTYSNGILNSEKNQSLINSNWQTVLSYDFEFSNGNIATQYTSYQNGSGSMSKYTREYDTKLNPMHYMNPVVRNIIGLESCDFKNTNNEIKQYRYSSATSTTPILDFTYQITYNSQNLPITIKKYTSNAILVSEATFQYN
jgi:hypothetical protein